MIRIWANNAEGGKVKIITLDDTVSQYIILTESLKDLNEQAAVYIETRGLQFWQITLSKT